MNTVMLSQAILLAISLTGGLSLFFIVTKLWPRIFRFLSWKICALTAGVYLGVLLLSYPILWRLPDKGLIPSAEQRDDAGAAAQSLLEAIYGQQPGLNEETIAHNQGVSKSGSRSFPVASRQLSLDIQKSSGNLNIFIEKKGTSDGRIDVSTYITAHFIGNVDFSKQISPPAILLKDETLQVIFPGFQTLNYQRLNDDFTLKQFKTKDSNNNLTLYGEQLVYIRVPANIQLNLNKDQGVIHELN